jgi:serine/threonine protein kinase
MKPGPRYQPGDKIGGRYQVHQALMGGMGEVYLCLDLKEMIPLALKTVQQRYLGDHRKLRAVFEQEVATWVALEKHPNIVRCFWMDIFDNQPFMALDGSLARRGEEPTCVAGCGAARLTCDWPWISLLISAGA